MYEVSAHKEQLINSIELKKKQIAKFNKILRETFIQIKTLVDDEEMKVLQAYVVIKCS